jgi:hypothetical protein
VKNINSTIVGNKNDIIDINKLCGECNAKFDYRDKSSTWITCESCSQGYHGNQSALEYVSEGDKGVDRMKPKM